MSVPFKSLFKPWQRHSRVRKERQEEEYKGALVIWLTIACLFSHTERRRMAADEMT